jgi:hypothetical protein
MGQLHIEAADLDTEAIIKEIEARLCKRRDEAQARGLDWQAYAQGLYPIPADAALSHELYEAVRHLEIGYNKTSVEMDLTEKRLPLIGNLVHRIRAALHELVLFYANRLASKQTRVNEETARALAALVGDLEAELSELRDRVSKLETAQR